MWLVANTPQHITSIQRQNHIIFYKGSWHIFLIPALLSSNSWSLICCRPLSVPSYRSVPRHISLHLSRYSSFQSFLSHLCFFIFPSTPPPPPPPHLFQLFLIKSYFNLLALWVNIMRQTDNACWHRTKPKENASSLPVLNQQNILVTLSMKTTCMMCDRGIHSAL